MARLSRSRIPWSLIEGAVVPHLLAQLAIADADDLQCEIPDSRALRLGLSDLGLVVRRGLGFGHWWLRVQTVCTFSQPRAALALLFARLLGVPRREVEIRGPPPPAPVLFAPQEPLLRADGVQFGAKLLRDLLLRALALLKEHVDALNAGLAARAAALAGHPRRRAP